MPTSYGDAGVDVAAGEEAVRRIRDVVGSTARPEVIGGIGGFGGAFALDVARWRSPVLVSSTDGVGTKIRVAELLGRYDTVGIDLVAMCVDDVVCVGAEPLFLLDYIVTRRLDPARMEAVVAGVAEGCRQAGCALVGGEMAEHPGEGGDEIDLAGFAVGAVERDAMLGPAHVSVGDVLVALPSPGLRSNGYSLARRVLLGDGGHRTGAGGGEAGDAQLAARLDEPAWAGATVSLGDELLRPSVVYARAVLAAVAAGVGGGDGGTGDGPPTSVGAVHAVAHITGGGITGNLVRVVPGGAVAVVDPSAWVVPPIFGEIQRRSAMPDTEMRAVFNMGIGMVLAVDPGGVGPVLAALEAAGHPSAVVGRVTAAAAGSEPAVRFEG